MSKYIETVEMVNEEIAITKNSVVFPIISAAVEFTDLLSVGACERAFKSGKHVIFVAQKNIKSKDVEPRDLYSVGTLVKIKQIVKGKDKRARVVCEGVSRVSVISYTFEAHRRSAAAMIKQIRTEGEFDERESALMRNIKRRFTAFAEALPHMPKDLVQAVAAIEDAGLLSDFIASSTFLNTDDKQAVLEEFDPIKRLELIAVLIEGEEQIIRLEREIQSRVRERIDVSQKEYYLREQLKVINDELGAGADDEIQNYLDRINNSKMPKECKEHLEREVKRLSRSLGSAAEAAALRNYLDTCMDIPFGK